jgi:hypothetical protein
MNEKHQELLEKLTPCIEGGDLEPCVDVAANLAREMGIGAEELLDLSEKQGALKKHGLAYVLALASA